MDKAGDAVDCLLTAKRDTAAAQCYLEQNHRAVKRVTASMLGFKSFSSAKNWIAGIETMHTIKKGQLQRP